MLSGPLEHLKQFRQFICYQLVPNASRVGKCDKIPTVSVTDPSKWQNYEDAQRIASQSGGKLGLGFVLTVDARIAVVDVDGSRDPQTGRLSPLALALIALLPGAYVEVSISGTGIHIWFSYRGGEMPAHACRANGIEFYHSYRFFAFGTPYEAEGFVNGSVAMNLVVMLPYLITQYFPPSVGVGAAQEWTEGPCAGSGAPAGDEELIALAMRSNSAASAFGSKASFADLWNADEASLASAWPAEGRPYDASSADMALATRLAWWTGKDCQRIDRLMRQSALARPKWETHPTYLQRTILAAVARQVEVYEGKRPSKQATTAPPPPPAAGGITLTPTERTLANVGTQDAVALIFTGRMTGKLLYDRTRNVWLEWDGTRWKSDRLGMAYNLIRDIARELNYDGKAAMASASFCDGVNRLLQNAPEFARTRDQFDRDNYLLNTPAGTLDLRTGRVRAHNPDDLLTFCTAVAPEPGGGKEFRKFLQEITLKDMGLNNFLKVSLGACLSGAIEGHWMLFWIGKGRNGKNTLGDLVQDAMGDYAKKVPASTLMAKSFEGHPTEIANLQGVRLATSSEVADGDHWDEARINEVTGDAKLSARFMRCDHFEFERTHKHLVYGNYKPQLRSVSDGIQSRIKIVPFNASFKGREDADLPKRLREHMGYVLRWLMEGHSEWLFHGKHLPLCATVEAESAQYFENQSTPQLWLAERCEIFDNDDRPALHLPKVSNLYRDYKSWKESRGEKAVSQARWSELMRFDKVRSTLGFHYRGLRLLPLQYGDVPFPASPLVPPPPKAVVQ